MALVTSSMVEERVMHCSENNGTKGNINTKEMKKKLLQRHSGLNYTEENDV